MSIIVKVDKDLADIVPDYLDNRRKEVAVLRDCISRQDFEKLHVLGHRLAGNAASYGFEALTDQGRLIERDAKAKTSEKMTSYVDFIEDYLKNVEVQYE